jgi:hypothetical protein
LRRRDKEGMSMIVDDRGDVNSFDQVVHFGGDGGLKFWKISSKELISESYTWREYGPYHTTPQITCC